MSSIDPNWRDWTLAPDVLPKESVTLGSYSSNISLDAREQALKDREAVLSGSLNDIMRRERELAAREREVERRERILGIVSNLVDNIGKED
jgi:hypothetical protein